MTKTDLPNGGYILTASLGYDLAIVAEDGTIHVRTNSVVVTVAGTLNNWQEVPKLIDKPKTEAENKAAQIATLEAELAALKNELVTGKL